MGIIGELGWYIVLCGEFNGVFFGFDVYFFDVMCVFLFLLNLLLEGWVRYVGFGDGGGWDKFFFYVVFVVDWVC